MKKMPKPFKLAKETVARLSDQDLESVGGGAPTTTNETIRCSRAQGSCLSCGPTFCP